MSEAESEATTGFDVSMGGGLTIHCRAQGDGPSVVLLPGFLMDGSWWWEAGYVERLSGHRIIAVDPLGFGRSSRPVDAKLYSSRGLADQLAAVVDAVGVEAVVVWGFSRGGALAADFAELYPDRVSGLVVGGTVLGVSGPDLLPLHEERRTALLSGDWDVAWPHLESVFGQERRARIEGDNDLIAAAAASVGPLDRVRSIDAIECPTLIYAGELEWTWPLAAEDAENMGAEFHRFDGLDHMGLFDAAVSVLNCVRPFIDGCGDGGPTTA